MDDLEGSGHVCFAAAVSNRALIVRKVFELQGLLGREGVRLARGRRESVSMTNQIT